MKSSAIFKYGFAVSLLLSCIMTGSRLYAQQKDSVQIEPFSTLPDTLPDQKEYKKKTVTDTPSAAFLDSHVKINWDSLQNKHSPRRAGLYSAVFPGLGQIYNRQFVKAPLMWGGIGVATGIFIFNFDHYITFRDAYRLRLNNKLTGDQNIDIYSPQDLKYIRDGYRQYVDYSVLGFAAVYLYNILDAVVFGYLFDFDVASPLSKVDFGPVLHQGGAIMGFGLTYHF